jgi:hypothetical protein
MQLGVDEGYGIETVRGNASTVGQKYVNKR